MRRTVMLLATMALSVLLACGVAVAAEIQCSVGTTCFGTSKADTLTGTGVPEHIYGLGGPDLIKGLGGADRISGGSGGDDILGGAGQEFIEGAGGDDDLRGGGDEDVVLAGNGDDTVLGNGFDIIHVDGDQQYGFQDEVFCSRTVSSVDTVHADPNDILHDCGIFPDP